MGEDGRPLDRAVRADGIRDDDEGVVRQDADGDVREEQHEAPLSASSPRSVPTGGSPCQPPLSVFWEIGVVQNPEYNPGPCQR